MNSIVRKISRSLSSQNSLFGPDEKSPSFLHQSPVFLRSIIGHEMSDVEIASNRRVEIAAKDGETGNGVEISERSVAKFVSNLLRQTFPH